MSKEFEFFLKANLKKYKGKYIAIVDDKVVASDGNTKVVWEKARKKYPNKIPTIAKLPKEEALILAMDP
jgi:hypothetical protein